MSIDYLFVLLLLATVLGICGLFLACLPSHMIQKWRMNRKSKKMRIDSISTRRIEPVLDKVLAQANYRFSETPALSEALPFRERKAIEAPEESFIILYLMAPEKNPYMGYELWQALTTVQLKYGEMKIFHYYNKDNERLFSVANAVEPGYFDLTDIGAVCCPGLCLFMQATTVSNPQKAFNCLVATAQQLSQELGGVLYDENRQSFTKELLLNIQSRLP